MIDKKLLEIWNEILKCNDIIIKTRDSIIPTCFIVKKDNSVQILAMIWRNIEEKEAMKYFIKKLIINQEILGYGVISDTYMTNMQTKEVIEIVMRNFYTPNETLYSYITHKGKKIIGEYEIPKEMKEGKIDDSWNLWNISNDMNEEDKTKIESEYDKFRKKYPELYGEKT